MPAKKDRTPDPAPPLLRRGVEGESEELPLAAAARVLSRFEIPNPVEAYDFPDKGNIHLDTFLVRAGQGRAKDEYILQRLNQRVFTRPDKVMASMTAALEAQQRNAAKGRVPEGWTWETITLVPTREGEPCLREENRSGRSCWRLMRKIPDRRGFKSLEEAGDRPARLRAAEEAGRGLAFFIDLTEDLDTRRLAHPLPGYRDTALYFAQLASVLRGNRSLEEAASVLPEDETVREATASQFLVRLPRKEYNRRMADPRVKRLVDLALGNEHYGLTLERLRKGGRIRTVAIHGDTKLENFLFCTRTGRVKALVDLDTIMPHTWLSDWGDMVRSLANVAGEKERDPGRVRVDLEIYEAVARGFLGTVRTVPPGEKELMADAVRIIALELGVRFLADYLRGDTYFTLHATDPPDLNRVRAEVQLTLFERLGDKEEEIRALLTRAGAGG